MESQRTENERADLEQVVGAVTLNEMKINTIEGDYSDYKDPADDWSFPLTDVTLVASDPNIVKGLKNLGCPTMDLKEVSRSSYNILFIKAGNSHDAQLKQAFQEMRGGSARLCDIVDSLMIMNPCWAEFENYLKECGLKPIPRHWYHRESRFELTDIGNAERFCSLLGNKYRYVPDLHRWIIWNGKHWELDELNKIICSAKLVINAILDEASKATDSAEQKQLTQWALKSSDTKRVFGMITLAQAELAISSKALDCDDYLLNCQNGIIDLKTGELLPHKPEYFITKICPVSYNPEVKSPIWESFVQDILPSALVRDYVQKQCGYSITGDTTEQDIRIPYGDGSNGKSTFNDALAETIGFDYLQVANSDLLLRKERSASNDIARLKGARWVIINETGDNERLDENRVKTLTGDGQMTARFLHKEFITFRQTYKIWLCTNHKPIVRGCDHAIWRRLKLIPFCQTFRSLNEKRHEAKIKDPLMLIKLRKEKQGVLTWLVEGCLKWQKEGLIEPSEVLIATGEYRSEMDTVQNFIEERCVQNPVSLCGSTDLYNAYQTFCKNIGENCLSLTTFGKGLERKGFHLKKKKQGNFRIGLELISWE